MDKNNSKHGISELMYRNLYPFPHRPWMNQLGAAAATGEGNKGLKGIVAGN